MQAPPDSRGTAPGVFAPGAVSRPPRIGLALSSGGARGFAHVGVIKALRAAGFEIAGVAGSSMGGIIAAGYALRADVAELERLVLAFRPAQHARRLLPVMDPERLTTFLDRALDGATFADCALPLTIVATDLERRAAAALREGSLALAAFATSAVPFLHRPVPWEGQLLADGALSCVLPIAQVPGDSVDLVLGSLVSRPLAPLNALTRGVARATRGFARGWQRPYVEFFRDRAACAPWVAPPSGDPPALVLMPALRRVGPLDFGRVREAIAAGEAAVHERLDELRAALGCPPEDRASAEEE